MKQSGVFFTGNTDKTIEKLLKDGAQRRRGEEELFNSYAYFIAEGTRKYVISEDDAFDAYSDTILSAIPKIIDGSFEGRSSLKTWLYQIFHNKCVDLLRKKTTNKNSVHQTVSISDMFLQLSDNARSVVQQIIDKTDMDVLREKMKALGENCLQLLLNWADGYSDKEIAAQMKYKTADVVKTSRLRCMEKLRNSYKSSS